MARSHSDGFILPAAVWAVEILILPITLVVGPRTLDHGTEDEKTRYAERRAWRMDVVQTGLLLFALAGGVLAGEIRERPWLVEVMTAIALWRTLNILAVPFHYTIFSLGSRQEDAKTVFSLQRSVILGLVNVMELMVIGGAYFAWHTGSVLDTSGRVKDWPETFYFSATSIMAIGYGDMLPKGDFRYVAAFLTAVALTVVALMVSRIIGSMRALRAHR